MDHSNKNSLPNLIIIGSMNCGTTSLHQYLDLHPEIQMSNPKEPCFFLDGKGQNWHKGIKWYQSLFNNNYKIRGESTANYTKYPGFKGAPEKMFRMIPNVKLIYLIRNPIERIVSHYLWQVFHADLKNSFEEEMKNPQWYLNCSRYYLQLEQYLNFYPESQILVLNFNSLLNDKAESLKKVFSFIGVNPAFTHKDFEIAHNQAASKKILTPLGEYFKTHNDAELKPILEHLIKNKPFLLATSVKRPIVSPEIRKMLIEELYDDIKKLEVFLRWDLSEWYQKPVEAKPSSSIDHTNNPLCSKLSTAYSFQLLS